MEYVEIILSILGGGWNYAGMAVSFLGDGITNTIISWIGGVLIFWGIADLYMFYRFRRGSKVDKTAALWHWISVKWCLASQTELMAEKLPFISKDLSEVVGVKDDDDKIT